MMLSQDEQRRLRVIEQQLRAGDPLLADRLAHGFASSPPKWVVPVAFVTAFVSVFGLTVGLLLPSVTLIVPAAVVLICSWYWLVRSVRRLNSTPAGR